MCKCPNCGSTAQVRHLCGSAYLCGCGQMFYVENGIIKTADQICDEYEKANKKGLTNNPKYAIIKVQKRKELISMIDEHERQVFELMWKKMFEENRVNFHVSDVFTDMDGYGFSLTSADGRFTIFLHNDNTFSIADWDWENGKINY